MEAIRSPILSLKSNLDQTSCVGLLGVPSLVHKKMRLVDSWNLVWDILSQMEAHTVPILSLKSNLDQTSCVGLLGVPSLVS